LCVLALMVVCAPLLPKEHRRAWRRWRAKKFDIKDMYGSLRYHLDHAYPASPSGDSFRDHFPSCTWRGYYKQYGSRHNLCSFSLQFSESTSGVFSIDGGGQDDVGRYGIDGEWNPVTRRLAFVKEYELGSRTVNGHIDWRENKGHRVLYKGEGLATPGQGFKGTWSLDVNSFEIQGNSTFGQRSCLHFRPPGFAYRRPPLHPWHQQNPAVQLLCLAQNLQRQVLHLCKSMRQPLTESASCALTVASALLWHLVGTSRPVQRALAACLRTSALFAVVPLTISSHAGRMEAHELLLLLNLPASDIASAPFVQACTLGCAASAQFDPRLHAWSFQCSATNERNL